MNGGGCVGGWAPPQHSCMGRGRRGGEGREEKRGEKEDPQPTNDCNCGTCLLCHLQLSPLLGPTISPIITHSRPFSRDSPTPTFSLSLSSSLFSVAPNSRGRKIPHYRGKSGSSAEQRPREEIFYYSWESEKMENCGSESRGRSWVVVVVVVMMTTPLINIRQFRLVLGDSNFLKNQHTNHFPKS